MRAVIQRAQQASVTLKKSGDKRTIGPGLLVLLGVGLADTLADAEYLAGKIGGLRIFDDESGKMNLALTDVPEAAMLVVSQFTLYGDTRKGRRPSFTAAAAPAVAIGLYEHFIAAVRAQGIFVVTGEFGADMLVEVANDGPVTLILDSV